MTWQRINRGNGRDGAPNEPLGTMRSLAAAPGCSPGPRPESSPGETLRQRRPKGTLATDPPNLDLSVPDRLVDPMRAAYDRSRDMIRTRQVHDPSSKGSSLSAPFSIAVTTC